jgi:bifunctional DNA-binding transcriptional regulator/antitoxin component of YhaV-PrlF toxin-antitoxin module
MMAATVKMSEYNQIAIPKEICDSLHWQTGMELTLITTEYGVMLQAKRPEEKIPAKALRGFLQHSGEPIPTEQLCRPVEYTNDSLWKNSLGSMPTVGGIDEDFARVIQSNKFSQFPAKLKLSRDEMNARKPEYLTMTVTEIEMPARDERYER